MKRMFDQFFPDEYMESTYSIPFEKLYQEGYRGVIFDIDNTLVPHGAPADERAKQLFRRLKEIGFESCLLSNNQKKRVEMFNQDVGTHLSSTIFVGDQLFTDVWGAKRAGIHNILVQPMNPKEEIQIVLKRYLEKIVLHFYEKECR